MMPPVSLPLNGGTWSKPCAVPHASIPHTAPKRIAGPIIRIVDSIIAGRRVECRGGDEKNGRRVVRELWEGVAALHLTSPGVSRHRPQPALSGGLPCATSSRPSGN